MVIETSSAEAVGQSTTCGRPLSPEHPHSGAAGFQKGVAPEMQAEVTRPLPTTGRADPTS